MKSERLLESVILNGLLRSRYRLEILGRSEERAQAQMGSLCEQRGRVTRSSCRPLPPLRTVQRTPAASFFPARHSRFSSLKNSSFFDGECRGPRATSPLQVGPPIRCELGREALRAPAHLLCSKRTYVNSNNPRMSKFISSVPIPLQ